MLLLLNIKTSLPSNIKSCKPSIPFLLEGAIFNGVFETLWPFGLCEEITNESRWEIGISSSDT